MTRLAAPAAPECACGTAVEMVTAGSRRKPLSECERCRLVRESNEALGFE
jgi:hypothetical protein